MPLQVILKFCALLKVLIAAIATPLHYDKLALKLLIVHDSSTQKLNSQILDFPDTLISAM